jgi:hypothetical protein
MMNIDSQVLAVVSGGAPTAAQQAELRALARQHCPATFQANQNRAITRPLAERCLNEAGYGWAKGRLDQYFGPR